MFQCLAAATLFLDCDKKVCVTLAVDDANQDNSHAEL